MRGDVSNARVEETLSRRKRDRDLGSLSGRQNLHVYRKLKQLFEENAQLRDDYLRLKHTWK